MSQEKRVKICMITTIAKSFEWFVSDSARNLADKGFDVTIMCSDMDEEFLSKHQQFARCIHLPAKRGIDLKSLIKSVRLMRKVFREEKFDIVQYSTPNAAFYCALSAGVMKKSLRIYNQWGLRYIGFTGLKRFIFKMVEKYTCMRSTHVISTSPKNMQFNIDEGLCPKKKISVIGKGGTIGVDFSIYDINKKEEYRQQIRQEYGIGENTFVFSFIGRLNADKGINELISAYRALTYRYKDTRLMLIGMEDNTNPPDKELIEWAKQSKNVIFTGVVPPQRVAQLMSATDMMVHPTYREGFSMVIQEGMAMALPILTTDVPGPSEVIVDGETGILVPSHSDKALLAEMEALMNDPERREKYSRNGRRRVELFFARPVMLQNIYTHYCRLLGIEDKHLKLMYLTANPQAAIEAENAGVDRIFLDLEILGKEERQGHLDTVVSHSSLEDVKKLRAAISKAKLLVRCNPVHKGLKKEIDRIINDGADIIMLPYFKTVEEVRTFLDIVGGRVHTVLLFETAEAVELVDEILELEGVDEVYIGLNDLHLSYGLRFMFELLTDGTVESLCNKFRDKGLSYGFGGIAKIGEGLLKSDYVIGEHKRLGSTCAILSRTFRNEVDASRPIDDFRDEFMLLRKREEEISGWDAEQFEENRQKVVQATDEIVQMLIKKAAAHK
ncbi:MAG: glycosyltransferase [Ruminococcus sp.]|nr:glycosyltransferase [Ruminococcus sp.]